MNTMTARDFRDVGTSKLPSLNASSTRTERMITSCRTVSSTRNPFLSNFPWIQTISTIRWRAPWTMNVCMPHSLLLCHDKFIARSRRVPARDAPLRGATTPPRGARGDGSRTTTTTTTMLAQRAQAFATGGATVASRKSARATRGRRTTGDARGDSDPHRVLRKVKLHASGEDVHR